MICVVLALTQVLVLSSANASAASFSPFLSHSQTDSHAHKHIHKHTRMGMKRVMEDEMLVRMLVWLFKGPTCIYVRLCVISTTPGADVWLLTHTCMYVYVCLTGWLVLHVAGSKSLRALSHSESDSTELFFIREAHTVLPTWCDSGCISKPTTL